MVFGIGQVGSSAPTDSLVNCVEVYVILVDGLEWLLAWRQTIGLDRLKVVIGSSDRASAQLDTMETLGHLLPRMEKSSIVCVMGMNHEAELDVVLRSILVGFRGRIIGLAPNPGRRRLLSFETLGAGLAWRLVTVIGWSHAYVGQNQMRILLSK